MPPSDEFRLEQVLNHARRQEEQKQLELKVLSEEERRLRDQLLQLRDQEQQQLSAIAGRDREGVIEPTEIDAALLYLSSIVGSITDHLDVVAAVEARVLESRDQLVEILREKQSLEKLKRRQAAEAALRENCREAKDADDMTSARFQRRTLEG